MHLSPPSFGGSARLRVAAACLLAAPLLASCSNGGAAGGASVSSGDRIPTSAADPKGAEMAHVHGVGRNAADGDVYVATHHGLWRVQEGEEPALVGAHLHDFMGFSVVGPDHFVASGHPNSAESLPPHLGLIESKDGGETWTSRSLLGDADFHALHVVGDTTFGWNSQTGALMASEDGSEWETLVEGMMMLDVAVDPADQETLIASVAVDRTSLALQRSADGGRTFGPVPQAPELARFAWPEGGTAWGFDVDGAVWTSVDRGRSWERVGDVGAIPDAVAGSEDELLAAADGRILVSGDGGRTWDELATYS